MLGRLSLRARLVLGVVVLAGAGLLVADAATYALLKSNLLGRVDSALAEDERALHGRDAHVPPGLFAQVRSLDGKTILETQAPSFGGEDKATPKLPATVTVSQPAAGEREHARSFTVPGEDGGR